MADQPKSTGPRAALWGFAEGFLIAGVAVALLRLVRREGWPIQGALPGILVYAIVGGVLYAIGRGISGRILGAFVGGVLGLFVGASLSQRLPEWNLPFPVQERPLRAELAFELAGPTLAGKPFDVADFRGKVVLVDFWATWCGPCLHELPTVKAAYDKYHAEGFEVVAVSLDDDRAALEKFVKDKDLPWPQVFFDEEGKRGWQNPVAKRHGVEGIPATFLLDREGFLVATNLRGPGLEMEVAQALRGPFLPMTMILCLVVGAVVFATAGAILQRRLAGVPG